MKQIPTEEQFLEWLSHPVTQAHQEVLQKWRESLKEQWAAGNFQAASRDESLLANVGALGQVTLLQDLIELDYDKLFEVLSDE